jgi:hypothetical protein
VSLRILACMLLLAACTAAAAAAPAPHATVPAQATLITTPAQAVAGHPTNMSISFQRLPNLQAIPTSSFQIALDQLLHMVGMGQDLDTFFHWHPTHKTSSMFSFRNLVIPKAGTYLVALNGQLAAGPVANSTKLAVAGTPVMSTAGSAAAAAAASDRADPDSPAVVTVNGVPLKQHQPAVSLRSLLINQTLNSSSSSSSINSSSSSSSGLVGRFSNGGNVGPGVYTVTLFGPQGSACKPGSPVTHVWTFTTRVKKAYSSTMISQPVNDLRPYYGAPMHLAVVSSNLGYIMHAHGEAVNSNSNYMANSSSNDSTMAGNSNAGDAFGARQPLVAAAAAAGHSGHGRKLLRMRDPLEAVAAAHSDEVNHTATSAKPQQRAGAAAAAPESPPQRRNGAPASNSVAPRLGPVLKTEVVFPTAGRYLLVGQVARGNELVLVPGHKIVTCTG